MAEVEEPQFSTLAERIAALNKQKNFNSSPASPPIVRSPSSVSTAPGVRRPPPPPVPTSPSKTSTAATRPTPPPVPRGPVRSNTVSSAGIGTGAGSTNGNSAALPQLPVRRPTQTQLPTPGPAPKLPPRRPSGPQLLPQTAGVIDRRPSSESVVSQLSTASTLSRVSSTTSHASTAFSGDGLTARKLPPAFGTTKLPPLPPSKREREAAEKAAAEKEAAEREAAQASRAPALPTRPGSLSRQPSNQPSSGPPLPPRLPPRPKSTAVNPAVDEPPPPALPVRRATTKSALELGFSSGKSLPRQPGPQQVPQRRWENTAEDDEDERPPPLPLASRPSRAQIDAVVRTNSAPAGPPKPPRPNVRGGGGGGGAPGFYPKKSEDEECMKCRDFSAPDDVASRFPLSVLPHQGTVEYLAHNLCDPFPSQTDKARAIFTWCHHNIAYDVDGFFGGCIPHGQTITERIFSGKSVCEGYARVYEAIALAAGLECVMVTGHGKGFGFKTVRPGDPVPPEDPTGHAWNAVRIDGGEWKLLDACWGAGNVDDKRAERYEKRFTPRMFTMTNDEFGERHFPDNPRYFFRADGRALPWAEYVVDKLRADPVILYSNGPEQFIAQESMQPAEQEICVSTGDPNEIIAFRLGRPCHHWTMEKDGQNLPPYPMMIQSVSPAGEREGEMHDVHFDRPLWFWADIPRRRLGRPGTTLFCYAMTTLNNRDMRGGTMAEFRERMGKPGSMGWQAVCSWRLV